MDVVICFSALFHNLQGVASVSTSAVLSTKSSVATSSTQACAVSTCIYCLNVYDKQCQLCCYFLVNFKVLMLNLLMCVHSLYSLEAGANIAISIGFATLLVQ